MSANFSDPTAVPFYVTGPSSKLSELVTGYNERVFATLNSDGGSGAISAAPIDLAAININKSPSVFYQMQTGLMAMVPYWVNPARLTESFSTVPTYGTWATFCAANNFLGFRRHTTMPGGTASYGTIQSGDILGNWIWQDLITVMSAMQKTVKTYRCPSTPTFTNRQVLVRSYEARASASLPDPIYDYNANWPAATWVAAWPTWVGQYMFFGTTFNSRGYYPYFGYMSQLCDYMHYPFVFQTHIAHDLTPPTAKPAVKTWYASDIIRPTTLYFNTALSSLSFSAGEKVWYDPLGNNQGQFIPGAESTSDPVNFVWSGWSLDFCSRILSGVESFLPDPVNYLGLAGLHTTLIKGCCYDAAAVFTWDFANSN